MDNLLFKECNHPYIPYPIIKRTTAMLSQQQIPPSHMSGFSVVRPTPRSLHPVSKKEKHSDSSARPPAATECFYLRKPQLELGNHTTLLEPPQALTNKALVSTAGHSVRFKKSPRQRRGHKKGKVLASLPDKIPTVLRSGQLIPSQLVAAPAHLAHSVRNRQLTRKQTSTCCHSVAHLNDGHMGKFPNVSRSVTPQKVDLDLTASPVRTKALFTDASLRYTDMQGTCAQKRRDLSQ